ncbi:MAG: hypothetical protein KKH99_11420, partial [Proteobacteria bacterium]|nr:hypothetical protein [Pseudomonadota bacterium]
ILNELSNNESFKIKGDPTYYTKGLFTKGKKKIKVVTATQHQMGIAASATLTLKMIKNFKPKYICMAGIAAGKKGEGNFGDIIIPTEVWDYGSGKITEKDEKTSAETNDFLFKPDPKYLSLDVELKELLNKNFRPILDTIKNDWKSIKPDSSLNIIKGPMACGSIVVQDESIIEKYIDPHNRKLKGLDMESYGVFYAAENSFMPKPKVLVCKSICDFADTHKDDKYQSYAAFTSIRFLKHLILEELL